MIRKWSRETEPNKVKLETFCFYSSLEVGAKIVGVVHLSVTVVVFVVLTTFAVTTHLASNCFGPVYIDFVDHGCHEALDIQLGHFGHETKTFLDEMKVLSAHFQVCICPGVRSNSVVGFALPIQPSPV